MCIEVRDLGGIGLVSLQGHIDHRNAGYVGEAMQVAARQYDRLIVDCHALEYISSSGLRAVLMLIKSMATKGGRPVFCGANTVVLDVLEVTGIRSLMTHCQTIDDAVEELAGSGVSLACDSES